jgi:catechol 2,3-dioxygenase-like lactoylglutathione lyase family enzyme
MITGLDHVQVTAPPGCEEAARAFYGGVLGLTEIPKPVPMQATGGVWFACGAQELHIGVEPDFAPARKAHPGFVTDDIDAVVERLDAVEWDERIPGARRLYTTDPFGNRLEIRQS